MNREETIEAIEVMRTWLDGAEIGWEWRNKPKAIESVPSDMPNWNWAKFRFFVKSKPKLILRVGAWYETKTGDIVQCKEIRTECILTNRGGFWWKENIVREVQVLPVEGCK